MRERLGPFVKRFRFKDTTVTPMIFRNEPIVVFGNLFH